ncbi:DNA alkylation repair protein [Maritalea sp.]|uniref:DNA alkylation repair protein n=1 Tax=Maritalea sp. TaxID=2003361 RepID=UPI003EF44C51
MPEPFKNFFNLALITNMAELLDKAASTFEREKFLVLASNNLDALELKERSNQIRDALIATLPNDIVQAGPILIATLGSEAPIDGGVTKEREDGLSGFAIMPMADFVAAIGLNDIKTSFGVLEELTKRFSAEFAVRPFIIADQERAMMHFAKWSTSENAHVRRLASEGCRPLLPWGLRLQEFVKDPAPIMPILETLKDDPAEYVRRSVANNINDIAKNQPDLVAQIATDWLVDANKNRERMVRHACRTLIKQGHQPTLQALGYSNLDAQFSNFEITTPNVKMGSPLEFKFTLKSTSTTPQPLILDYAIHFKKANGDVLPKVFKLKTGRLKPSEKMDIVKSQMIKPITTRTFYAGEHKVEILANGKSLGSLAFELTI